MPITTVATHTMRVPLTTFVVPAWIEFSIDQSWRALFSAEFAMKFYTVGYGGRIPNELASLLATYGIRSVADVRIRPDRASMGAFVKARTAEKGIERLLAERGIAYQSIIELGNMFRDLDDWRPPYRALFERAGDLLVSRLDNLPAPFCLMCAEKRVTECHRQVIADFLVTTRDWSVEHLE
jgi:uncharacterized protein (DUF488 family)